MAAPAIPDASERAIVLIVDILEGRWEAAREQFGAALRSGIALADRATRAAGR
jgi:hypothetical protein